MKVFEDILSTARLLLADIDTPRSLMIKILIDHGEWAQIAKLTCDPSRYLDPDTYFRDVIATDFLRKWEGMPTGINRKAAAVDAFIAAEKQCYRTNREIRSAVNSPSPDGSQQLLLGFLDGVKKRISRVLGRLPDDLPLARFGPGATFDDKGRQCSVVHKMSSRPTVTPLARELLVLWGRTAWSRSLSREFPNRSDPKTVHGNRFTSVPKTAVTDRGIAVEPSINVFYQLAVGSEIRWRLKVRAGIDLNFGQDQHRTLARLASLGARELATIDLSSASDTVSYMLVKAVLPDDWFQLLESLRSPFTWMGDRRVHLQKFSSMGNGFTFELETLIFWAIAQEACGGSNEISVYGDDIIVPLGGAEETLMWLDWLGFTPNRSKTFLSGYFRESCGGDFFRGVAVRPYYVKKTPANPSEWISLYNGLERLRYREVTRRAQGFILGRLPYRVRRLRGPVDLGDLVLLEPDPLKWWTRRKDGIRYVKGIRPILPRIGLKGLPPLTVLALALYGTPSSGVSLRGSPVGYRECWIPFS